MSLACFECKTNGTFNTLVIFDPDGTFDAKKYVSSYPNFYTCCASFYDFPAVEKSRFVIVLEREHQDSWNTATDGDRLEQTEYKRINEAELRKRLPKIFDALVRCAGQSKKTS